MWICWVFFVRVVAFFLIKKIELVHNSPHRYSSESESCTSAHDGSLDGMKGTPHQVCFLYSMYSCPKYSDDARIASSYGMRLLKNMYDAAAYSTNDTGFINATCDDSDQKNHPQYEGCRTTE
eukprot:Rhum_TRINITY_DN9150_c0_g1::Rhum_TRINITY_DN9150_c0_g1_i1::g.31837::m.31837